MTAALAAFAPAAAPRAALLHAVPELDAAIEAARAGDASAYARLVERYHRGIYGLCLRMCGNPADAEELTQEAFVRAFRHLDRFDPRHKFSTWIYRIALNACRDLLRARPHRETAYGLDPGPLPEERREGPDGHAARAELRRALSLALEQLSPKYREALVLRHVEGLPYEEIAQITGDTVGALKVRVVRGRAMLLERLVRIDPSLANSEAVEL